jgi:acyl-CoA dehydrogenase
VSDLAHEEGKAMLGFTLTEEQRNIRDLAHYFADKESDRSPGNTTATAPGRGKSSKRLGCGAMNSQLPEEYDGAGASYVDGAVIGEELAWGCAIGTTLGTNELAARRCCSAALSGSRSK